MNNCQRAVAEEETMEAEPRSPLREGVCTETLEASQL